MSVPFRVKPRAALTVRGSLWATWPRAETRARLVWREAMNKPGQAGRDGLPLTRAGQWHVGVCLKWEN